MRKRRDQRPPFGPIPLLGGALAWLLTAAGGVLLNKLRRQVVQHEKRLLQNFSEQEHATFIALLQKVFPEHR